MSSKMLYYILKRILLAVLTIWIVITVTFFVMHAVPGGPFMSEKAISKEAQAALEAKYGLDKPLFEQYTTYLRDIVTKFDFGPSLKQRGRQVIDIIMDGMKTSAKLGLIAAFSAAVVGIVLGAAAAIRRNTVLDKVIMVITTAFVSMPSFIMGSFLLIIFAVKLGWLPANGSTGRGLILPVITLALYPMAYITRLTRSSMLDVLGQDYIRTARAKGVSRRSIIFGHALKNSLIPVLTYFGPMLAFPVYMPVREDVVADEAWATNPATYVCNGPYTMTAWEHNSKITLTKNPAYHDAADVTMDTLEFYLSDDANNMLANFQNGDWQLIDDVPTSEIATLKETYPTEFVVAGQIGTYYVCWNINENILPATSELTGAEAEKAEEEIRNAVALLFDRNYIVTEIGQAGQVPASSFVAMGMTDADGSEFYKNAGSSDEYDGYYNVAEDAYMDNWDKALEVLKKYYTYDESTGMFTDFPSMTYLYNTSEGHKAIGEYLQSALAGVGITLNLENQEWNTFLNTRKAGDYTIARNGWLADYNDPICFLDMWVSESGNNDVQYGKGDHAELAMYSLDLTSYGYDVKVENGTWAETYDVLISTIKSCTDSDNRYAMMHIAEDMLMQTGCITPLYFYTDIYMIDDSVKGFYSNPLGYKYFMHCTIEG